MPSPDNAAIADQLDTLAALLDAAGAGRYSVRAYRRAADLVRSTPAPVAALVRSGRVRELRGVGPAIEARLRELVETGGIAEIEALKADLGPKLASRARRRRSSGRALRLDRARALTVAVADAVGGVPAGDARRFRDRCERLAVAVPADDPAEALDRFAGLPQIVLELERDAERAVAVTTEGVPVEAFAAPPHRFGAALVRATGSEEYVAALGELPDAPDEEGVYRALGIPWLPPELREAPTREAAPPLVEVSQIRGDLHVHTTWSDGRASVLEMAEAARGRGYEYLAICDHTRSVTVVPGLDADGVRRQGEEIARANELLAPFRVLRGIECDILVDGSLDLPDDVLAELDWVQASVHAGQRRSREELTARTLAAVHHPAVRSISHPQGRILGHRPPNAVDLEAVFAACAETGTAVETNGLPDRLDLSGELVREAIRAGVRITCSTDAHSVRGLGNIELSVGTARRGAATAADVLNTLPLADLLGGS
ncbi:MAG TPA: DNA polymerase/3'-5' exonuclease PolX [Gaiellaceae bacterium]|nr:DNA polymerase/3'-5' exonuclease PolX [Gaiellaceae bacterium]